MCRYLGFLLLVVLGFISVNTVMGQVVKKGEEQKPLIASGHPNYPPFMWEENGKLNGVSVNLAKEVLNKLKINAEIKPEGTWKEDQEKCQEGKIDVIVGVYRNKKRQKYLDFTAPYLMEPVMLCVKKGNSFPFRKHDQLRTKKGITNVGESYGEQVDSLLRNKLDVKEIPLKECYEQLLDGKADYLIISKYSGIIEAERYKVADKVEFLPNPLTHQKIYLGINKNSKYRKFLPKINAQIKGLQRQRFVVDAIEKMMKYYRSSVLAKPPVIKKPPVGK